MFSFFNKFMLRSLFIKSLFVLVLPLSTEFAMKECEEDNYKENNGTVAKFAMKEYAEDKDKENNGTLAVTCEILPTAHTYQKGKKDIDTPKGEKKDRVEYPKIRGKNKKKKQGYNQSLSSIFCGVYNEERSDPIFDYRCATFLFFCPLVFNSLLNFIFEIDNKPSGMFLNFFSVGWRTPLLLNFITFDIHFNWFLFAISAYFDFVYFPEKYCPRSFDELLGRNIIPLFLFSFVFDAVSLCVNFKVDDYFYITVNLSSILRTIVNGLFVISKKEEKTRMKSSCTSKTNFSVHGYNVYNDLHKNYKEDDNRIKKVNIGNINITDTITRRTIRNNKYFNIEGEKSYYDSKSEDFKDKNNNENMINNIDNYNVVYMQPNLENSTEKFNKKKEEGAPYSLIGNLDANDDNNMFHNMTPGLGIQSYNTGIQWNDNISKKTSVNDLFKDGDDVRQQKKNIFDINQLNPAQPPQNNLGENVNNNAIHNENIGVPTNNVEVNNSLMDLKAVLIHNIEDKGSEDTVPAIYNNTAICDHMQVNNSFNKPEIKKEEDILINDIDEEKKNENRFEEEKSREDENFKTKDSLNKSINSKNNSLQDHYKSPFEIITESNLKGKRRNSLDLSNGKNIADNLIYKIENEANNENKKDDIKNNNGVLGSINNAEGENVDESKEKEEKKDESNTYEKLIENAPGSKSNQKKKKPKKINFLEE